MPKKYVIKLNAEERRTFEQMVKKGKSSAQQIRRAQTLLMSDEGETDEDIAELLRVTSHTVALTRKRWVEGQWGVALKDSPRPGRQRKLDGKGEALLVALACSEIPDGHEHWTMQMLADKLVALGVVEGSLSDETVRLRLQKTNSNPGSRNNGVFRARLEQTSSGGWKMFWSYMGKSIGPGSRWSASTNALANSGPIPGKACP
jgi:transposase